MKIEIKSWLSGIVLFEGDSSCLADAVKAAVASGADLSGANLSGADLSRADLSRADLSGANLSGANLSGANLSRADLSGADLSRADLSGANLSGANLSRADLSRAYLSRANLSRANLSGANLYAYAQIVFREHGECGRMLTAICQKEVEGIRFFCGCFNGTEKELRDYIANGAANLRKTRTLALETCLTLIAAKND